MKTRFFAILALLTCALFSVAAEQSEEKEKVVVSGVVTSAEDGEPLAGVVVMMDESVGGGHKHLY